MTVPAWLLAAAALYSTSAGPRESTEVLRAQIQIATCSAPDAGTADPVSAYVGGRTPTWLDYPGPDLERNRTYRYDLVLDGISTLADLTRLELRTMGSDDLCIRELLLIVNGTTIFGRILGGGRWLGRGGRDRAETLTISAYELRANPYWQSYSWSLSGWIASTGATVSREEIIERLQSYVATAMHDNGLSWGTVRPSPVAIRSKGPTTLRADLDLSLVVDLWFDPDVNVGFEVAFCESDELKASIRSLTVTLGDSWWAGVMRTANVERRLDEAAARIGARLRGLRSVLVVGALCPHVNADASLSF